MQPEGRRGQVPGRRRDSILLRALRHPRELLRPGRPGRHPAPHPRGGRCRGRRGGHAGGAPGGAVGMAEGGGRGGHPHPHHVEGHRAADAHAQGGVQAQPGEDCLRDERVEPLQGVPRLHGVVRGACGRPDGGHAAPVRGVRAGGRCRRVRGRVRPQGQGREGDARPGGHGARGCGVPERITAGQSRVPYGQIEAQGV